MSRDRAIAAALFIIATGVYVWTLCPSVYVEGSGELIGATWWLGTPHPTGYPLYTLLARLLAASMPMSSPAAAVNAATALLSAAVAPALYLLLRERRLTRASAAVAAAALVFGRTFWSQAVIAEVYGLFVLCSVLVLAASLRVGAAGPMRSRWLLLSGYIGGVRLFCGCLSDPVLVKVLVREDLPRLNEWNTTEEKFYVAFAIYVEVSEISGLTILIKLVSRVAYFLDSERSLAYKRTNQYIATSYPTKFVQGFFDGW